MSILATRESFGQVPSSVSLRVEGGGGEIQRAARERDSSGLPEDTHRSSHECFTTVLVLPDQVQELKDGFDEWLQERLCVQISVSPFLHDSMEWPTLAGRSHRQHDSTPGIHDALTERDDIVEHLVWSLWRGRDVSRLLQHLRDDRKVHLEVSTDGLSEVPETLKDSRFELIAQGGTLG